MKSIKHEIHKMRFLIAACIPFLLVGCNTIEGAGTDIKHAGKAIETTAEESKANHPQRPYCPSCPPRTRAHKASQ